LFHLGVPAIVGGLSTQAGRQAIEAADLPPAVRQAVRVGIDCMDQRAAQLAALRSELVGIANHQPACLALHRALFGVGPLTATFIWAEMGDTRRFSSSDDAVRHAGLDITVYSSDDHRAAGHLARQGPGALRWALYEAAKNASRPASPDHAYYRQARARLGAQRAALSVARKLARRAHHILRACGDAVLAGWDRPPDETYEKLPFYAAHKVGEVLVVDPGERRIRILALDDNGDRDVERSAALGVSAAELEGTVRWF
jgi:transposase